MAALKNDGRFQKGGHAGRPKGSPNKVTRDLRVLITELVEYGMENALEWLKDVAEGEEPVLGPDGKVINEGRPPNPARALDALSKLAEYGLPKLARHEVMGDGGGPVKVEVRKVYLTDSPYDAPSDVPAAGKPLDEE